MARGFVPDEAVATQSREAASADLTIDQIGELARHKKSDVRAAVAGRPDLPITVLIQLAQDKKSDVREAVASNPALDRVESVMELLCLDRKASVLTRLVRNPAVPFPILQKLAVSGNAAVREAAVERMSNPTGPSPSEEPAERVRTAPVRGFKPRED